MSCGVGPLGKAPGSSAAGTACLRGLLRGSELFILPHLFALNGWVREK